VKTTSYRFILALENQIAMSQNGRLGSWQTPAVGQLNPERLAIEAAGALRSLIQPESYVRERGRGQFPSAD
jgi:hypothetical protein